VATAVVPPAEARAHWTKKMAGSTAELYSYIGSGTFYVSGYSNAYVSGAVFLRPTYDLGTRLKLSANARVFLEYELTQPDNPEARRFHPYDVWLWLSARELHMFERPKIKLSAVTRLVLPLSHESRYSHMVTGLGTGLGLARGFEWGADPAPERRWKLTLSLSSVFTKYLHTSELRGAFPGDTTGCRRFTPAAGTASGGGAPTGAESDRCGGPVNTSFAVLSSGTAALARGKVGLAVTLLVTNSFRYSIPADAFTAIEAVDRGRSDTTWGIITLSYEIRERLGASIGLSSFQEALDSRRQNLRFPFFDLSGGANANNFTQVFVGLSGKL
jgi:hypothetical protein